MTYASIRQGSEFARLWLNNAWISCSDYDKVMNMPGQSFTGFEYASCFFICVSVNLTFCQNCLYNFLVCGCLIPTVLIRGTTWITLSKLGNVSIIEAIVIRNQHFLPGLFIDIKWTNFWWAADYFFVFIVSCFFYFSNAMDRRVAQYRLHLILRCVLVYLTNYDQ